MISKFYKLLKRICVGMMLAVMPVLMTSPLVVGAVAPEKPQYQKEWESRPVDKGVVLMRKHGIFFADQLLNVNVLKIQPLAGSIRFHLGYVPTGRVKTSEMCRKAGAIAGINGGYFRMETGGAISFLKVGGKTINAFGRKISDHQAIETGAVVIGSNGRLRIEPSRDDAEYEKDANAVDVMVAGPLLINDGKLLPLPPHGRHPRSGLGITGNGEILMVTVDGRTPQSQGLTYKEMQSLMDSLDCEYAINLDGGGSTTLWVNLDGGRVINKPCDNGKFDEEGERPVANCLMVLSSKK